MSEAPQFYIFFGDDALRRREALARMRRSMGDDGELNCSEFDGAATPLSRDSGGGQVAAVFGG